MIKKPDYPAFLSLIVDVEIWGLKSAVSLYSLTGEHRGNFFTAYL